MWTIADQMARLAVNQWSSADERKSAIPPFYIVSTAGPGAGDSSTSRTAGPVPTGFQDAFKKLWGV